MLHEKKARRTPQEIETKFGIPPQLAEAYAQQGEFFSQLRGTRDSIVHSGGGFGFIIDTERGFCVRPDMAPFSSFTGWHDEHRYNENLVSLLPWIANIVQRTIDACNTVMTVLASVIKFPPEIAPGYHIFVRGPSTQALFDVLQVSRGASPWWGEAELT